MKEAFIAKRFSEKSLETLKLINQILVQYEAQGFRLSLRQLYYQLVARDYIENTVRSYKNIGNLVSNARQAGLIDWDMIEDRGRETVSPPHWATPADIIRVAANQFRIDKWEGQEYHVEVMVEKDALSGVLEPVCRELDIRITANKGYSSSSTMYEIGQRLYDQYDNGKSLLVVYLGDHDPSGIDMTRDVEDRLSLYSRLPGEVEVIRIALNMAQIELWRPPENPAKETDARYSGYAAQFGTTSSWELDAVEPAQLADLVRQIVYEHRDDDLWEAAVERETKMRLDLKTFADTYVAPEDDDAQEDE